LNRIDKDGSRNKFIDKIADIKEPTKYKLSTKAGSNSEYNSVSQQIDTLQVQTPN